MRYLETKQHGGARKGAGRKPTALGAGVKKSVMIPEKLVEAIERDAEADGTTFSLALVARLRRGKKRGRTGI